LYLLPPNYFEKQFHLLASCYLASIEVDFRFRSAHLRRWLFISFFFQLIHSHSLSHSLIHFFTGRPCIPAKPTTHSLHCPPLIDSVHFVSTLSKTPLLTHSLTLITLINHSLTLPSICHAKPLCFLLPLPLPLPLPATLRCLPTYGKNQRGRPAP